jgi:ADP-ribosylglycohydrolase
MDFRRCQEPGVLDVLTEGRAGTMEDHSSSHSDAGALMTGAAAALFYDPGRLRRKEIHRLAAESAALTHGDPAAFLSGAALAHILSRILFDGEADLERLTREAGAVLLSRFGREYHAVRQVRELLKKTRYLAKTADRLDALSRLGGEQAHRILASALYLCLTGTDDLQGTVRTAAEVSPGCGAVAGAILGALRGEEAIGEALLEELECADVLRELAGDLFGGCPMMKGSRVFDIEWDEKYHVTDL